MSLYIVLLFLCTAYLRTHNLMWWTSAQQMKHQSEREGWNCHLMCGTVVQNQRTKPPTCLFCIVEQPCGSTHQQGCCSPLNFHTTTSNRNGCYNEHLTSLFFMATQAYAVAANGSFFKLATFWQMWEYSSGLTALSQSDRKEIYGGSHIHHLQLNLKCFLRRQMDM